MTFPRKKHDRFPARVPALRDGVAILLAFAGLALAMMLLRRLAAPLLFPAHDVTPEDAAGLAAREKGNPGFVILDVRSPLEFGRTHLPVAITVNVRSATFRDEAGKLDREKTYLVYSGNDNRSRKAAAVMRRLGFRTVLRLAGGLGAWERAGLPVVREE